MDNYEQWLKKFEQSAEKILETGKANSELHKKKCEEYVQLMQKERSRRNRR